MAGPMLPQIYDGIIGELSGPLLNTRNTGDRRSCESRRQALFSSTFEKNGKILKSELLKSIALFAEHDDVFSKDFLTDFIGVQGGSSETIAAQELETFLGTWSLTNVFQVSVENDEPLPPGPYFRRGNRIHQAWKLYADTLDAFSVAVYPQDVHAENTTFSPLQYLDGEGVWKTVAVPSRLYFSPSASKSLAGKRITVKYNYRLAGVKTTMSSRPYEATYGPENETASFVQKLMKLGAVVIGKSKMSSFVSSEEPTDQWVDFHAPFNPRESRATGRREYHPITASLVGASGSDLMLIKFARETFAHAGWTETLQTGENTWKLGKAPRNIYSGYHP